MRRAADSTRVRLYAPPPREAAVPAVAAACAVVLALGYRARDELYVTPDAGLGYGLGVAGLAGLVLLLLYSARKRLRALRGAGSLRPWFRVHMLLGVLGPAAILLHSNFHLGSLNGAVALVSMLLVAGSGFVGRFVYTRVHHGLFGHRESLREVGLRMDSSRSALAHALRDRPAAAECVRAFEALALARPQGPLDAMHRLLLLGRRARATRRRVRKLLRVPGPAPAASSGALEEALRAHLAAVRRVAEFGVYERALSLWHAVHLPLCVVLYTAAAVHVVAVHLY